MTDMTQAPTPGLLSAEDVKLLVKGDLLRIDTGGALYEFVRRKSSPSGLIVAKPALGGSERYYDCSRFLFVERPSLAPTAPVEASGSKITSAQLRSMSIQAAPSADDPEAAGSAEPQVGRAVYERIEKLLTTKPQGWERDYLCHLVESVEELGGYDGPRLDRSNDRQTVADFLKLRDESVGHSEVDDAERLESADAILAALRPQPSGETRPTDEEIRSAIKATEYKYFGDYEFSEEQHAAVDVLVRAAQALLSARPLALGGQQGEAEGCGDCPYCDAGAPNHCRHYTTPARAEAQDEGAAGEPVAWFGDGNYEPTEAMIEAGLDHNHRNNSEANMVASFKSMMVQAEIDGLINPAHPSPTPAADADRVRAEINARDDNAAYASERIAALKSEGK